jgi:predicted nucleotidyltransferase
LNGRRNSFFLTNPIVASTAAGIKCAGGLDFVAPVAVEVAPSCRRLVVFDFRTAGNVPYLTRRQDVYNSIMPSKPTKSESPPRWYRGADVPRRLIRRFARQVAERFQPEKIILFGSYAYGTPHEDSDVDLLVVMPARNELDQAVRIRRTVDYNFPLDLIVRTPKNLEWRLAEGDSFLREVVSRGKLLYEKADGGMGAQGRSRLPRRPQTRPQSAPDA